MFSKIKYPALNAKMKGMYAKELDKEELDELLRQATLKDAIYYLKTKFSSLDKINENMNRREIEQELNNLFIEDILKISKYLNKNEKNIFDIFLLKYEIDLVKKVFRNVITNRDSKKYLKNIDNWTNALFTNIQDINDVNNEEDFFEKIKNQDYYYIFEGYKEFENDIPLEDLEVKLDKYYFQKIYNSVNNNIELEKMIGTEIDLLNIITIYRSKIYFNYTEEEIKNNLIQINYKINKKDIDELIKSKDFEEMINKLDKTSYKNVFKHKNDMEHDKNKLSYDMYTKYFKEKLFNLCTVFCNINLIDIEIKNIINIIEGIRYNLDKTEIQKKIII